MQRMFIFLLFIIFFPAQILAGVGDADNRYYVTDEMWAKEPYNKFVYLEIVEKYGSSFFGIATCTAQYIAPNLILSAGHCIDKDADGYRVTNYKHEKFFIKLIETPYNDKININGINDWSVFLVTDPTYYSASYFNPLAPNKTISILNAGYGWVKILSNDTLSKIRQILSDRFFLGKIKGFFARDLIEYIQKQFSDGKYTSYYTCKFEEKCCIEGYSDEERMDKMSAECGKKFPDYGDSWRICWNNAWEESWVPESCDDSCLEKCEQYDIFTDREDRLKASKCNILYERDFSSNAIKFPYVLRTTCDSWGGNSGGGYVSADGKYLYGVCSFGRNENVVNVFTDNGDRDYIASALQFEDRIKELIKEYDSKNPVEQNIAKIPQISFDEEVNYEKDDQMKSQKVSLRMNNRIQKLRQEKENIDKSLMDALPEVKNMSDKQLSKYVGQMAEYQIKSEQLEKLQELQQKYNEAKANEQSLANRTLTALTVAATGIGGMELARGLAEQKADKDADMDMTAYIETMRCTYGNGKQVKGGTEEIELPGANDQNMMNLRAQYVSLAADLKERKNALDMKPGIESEEILDKTQMGLYDDENSGIENGAYSSIYRAKALNDDEDQAKIDEDKDASKKRVMGGGIAAGAGAVGGAVGNILINGTTQNSKK